MPSTLIVPFIATAPQLTPNNLNENVNGGPVKVIAYAASSVCIKVSFLVGVIATNFIANF